MWKFHQYLYNKQNITWPLAAFAALTCERYFLHSKMKFVSPRKYTRNISASTQRSTVTLFTAFHYNQ